MTVRYSDEDDSGSPALGLMVGALAGFAVGVIVAQKMGGLSGIAERLRSRLGGARGALLDPVAGVADLDDDVDDLDVDDLDVDDLGDDNLEDDDLDDIEDDDYAADGRDEDFESELEERVLEAFRNDPILCECAIDIGAVGDGIIELAGMVDLQKDADHAVTVARGVPDVETVINRILVGTEESVIAETAARFASGDPALTEAHWEGQQVGTGRRRQGTSQEFDRHADPKPELEDRWLSQSEALRNSAEDDPDVPGVGNRAKKGVRKAARGGRTDGSPVAPTGVPEADHVKEPESAPDSQRAD